MARIASFTFRDAISRLQSVPVEDYPPELHELPAHAPEESCPISTRYAIGFLNRSTKGSRRNYF
jgi:hypothetical protein